MPDMSDSSGYGHRYCDVRTTTEALAEPLGPEDQTVQSMPDVSPTKWHRAHTTWFFEEFVLQAHADGHQPYHPHYGYLFNSYYEAVGDRHPRAERGLLSRPTVSEIAEYRLRVDDAMLRLLESPRADELWWLVELGLHHEQQHQELLLMDAKHVLSQGPLDPAYRSVLPPDPGDGDRPMGWIEHRGGLVDVGHEGPGFAYDNEGPVHRVWLEPFEIADRPVTAGDWLEFMHDGGYQRPELWLSEGWAAVQADAWRAPLYWRDDEGTWSLFTLGGRRPVHPGEPVCHVSYHEADAFARWASARLPTEAEWETIARGRPVDERHCLDLDALHPRPVGGPGISQLCGGVWEWTASAYAPYPGFEPGPGAIGEYNGKFMVNQQVLRGGSCVTPRGHVRPTYRNFFPASARWAFSGLRLAREVAG